MPVEKWGNYMKMKILFLCIVAVLAIGPAGIATSTVHAAGPAIAAPAKAPVTSTVDPMALLYGLGAIGAIRIKDTGSLAKKFVQRAGAAAADYKDGVGQAGQDWETNTKAAAATYRDAVIAAAGEGRFERGVAAAGAAKFVKRATELGSQRFTTGVQAAEGDWARGTQPYLDALKGLELGPRRPRGQNADRANAVAQRLHQMRVGK